MTLQNLGDLSQRRQSLPLRQQSISELIETLNKDYDKAESRLKAIELELVGRKGFEEDVLEGLFLPSINEFRYASRHIVSFLASKDQESDGDQLIDAILHCRRAQRDATDCLFSIYLEMCRRILESSRRSRLSKAYCPKGEFETDCQELNKIARKNLKINVQNDSDDFIDDKNEDSVEECELIEEELCCANKELKRLVDICDRLEKAFFARD